MKSQRILNDIKNYPFFLAILLFFHLLQSCIKTFPVKQIMKRLHKLHLTKKHPFLTNQIHLLDQKELRQSKPMATTLDPKPPNNLKRCLEKLAPQTNSRYFME